MHIQVNERTVIIFISPQNYSVYILLLPLASQIVVSALPTLAIALSDQAQKHQQSSVTAGESLPGHGSFRVITISRALVIRVRQRDFLYLFYFLNLRLFVR